MNILLGLTGSVATVLAEKMVKALLDLPYGPHHVRVVCTGSAESFVESVAGLGEAFYPDESEWRWIRPDGTIARIWKKGDEVVHIMLADWADIFVIAPLSANTLGKMVSGVCDNLLTCVARAWEIKKPMFVAPAMHTRMLEHPVTKDQLRQLTRWGVSVLPTQSKTLACGQEGDGAMADVSRIMDKIKDRTKWEWPLSYPMGGTGLPTGHHPGAFGFPRKHDIHTGVDLYSHHGVGVYAMEAGKVLKIIDFTGKKVLGRDGKPMDWWLDTKAVLIKGASGVICYGEVSPRTWSGDTPALREGQMVNVSEYLGGVSACLPYDKIRKDIPGHSVSMLHVELYTDLYDELGRGVWEGWELNAPRPTRLLDPTPRLLECRPREVELLPEWHPKEPHG